MIRVKIKQLAGLILHNSAEFLSCLFLKQLAFSVQCGVASPSLLLPAFLCTVSGPDSPGVLGGGTCTCEDSLTGKPGVYGCVCVFRMAMAREGWSSSGEVHGPQGVVVNLNCFGQCLGVPTVTLTGHMAALSTVRWTGEDQLHSISNTTQLLL